MSIGGSRERTDSRVFEAQQPALQQLFSQAQDVAARNVGPVEATARRLSERFSPGLARAAEAAEGLATGSNPFLRVLRERATGADDRVGGIIDAVRGDLREQFTEDILPEIGSAAELAGARGSSRQGVAEGIAARGLNRQFGDIASRLRFEDQIARDQAAAQGGQLQLAGVGAAGQGVEQAFNLGIAPFSAGLGVLGGAADVVGRPTVLNRARSSSFNLAL